MAEIQMSQFPEGTRVRDIAKDGDVLVMPNGARFVVEEYYQLVIADDDQIYKLPEPVEVRFRIEQGVSDG